MVKWATRKLRATWPEGPRLLGAHPARAVAIVLLVVGLVIGVLSHSGDLAVELVGIAVTVLLIDSLNEYRAEQREKRALILQMGSPDNSLAVEAARRLRARGWLYDGSLGGANLVRANLEEAELWGANLQRARLVRANLQEANLGEADLQEADLTRANLQEAKLWGANLQEADLRWADLSTAQHLETAKLDGAKANSETQWPEGFLVPDTVVMVED